MGALEDFKAGYGGRVTNGAAAATSDTVDLPGGTAQKIYVQGAGAIKINLPGGTTITMTVAANSYHDIPVSRIWAIGTTATGIFVFY